MIEDWNILIIGLFVLGGVSTYLTIKKNKKNQIPIQEYKVNKSKGYDYDNPTRFFAEPLMRYTLLSLLLSFATISPFAVIAGIMNDGGKYLIETYPFTEYILLGWLITGIPLAILYTILYYVREWDNHQKWGMRYA